MKINQNQKRTLMIGVILIITAVLVWIGFGGEIFTKTEVLIEKQDELLGNSYKEWKEQFILGLDYTLGFIGVVFIIITFFTWRLRNKSSQLNK